MNADKQLDDQRVFRGKNVVMNRFECPQIEEKKSMEGPVVYTLSEGEELEPPPPPQGSSDFSTDIVNQNNDADFCQKYCDTDAGEAPERHDADQEFEAELAALLARRSDKTKEKHTGLASPAKNRYKAALRPTLPTAAGRHKVLCRHPSNPPPPYNVASSKKKKLIDDGVPFDPVASRQHHGLPPTDAVLGNLTVSIPRKHVTTESLASDSDAVNRDATNLDIPQVSIDRDDAELTPMEDSKLLSFRESDRDSVDRSEAEVALDFRPAAQYRTARSVTVDHGAPPENQKALDLSSVDLAPKDGFKSASSPDVLAVTTKGEEMPPMPLVSPSASPSGLSPISLNKIPRVIVANGTRRLGVVASPTQNISRSSIAFDHECSPLSGMTNLSPRLFVSKEPSDVDKTLSEELVVATVVKAEKDSKTGISFKRGPNGSTYVSKIADGGLFSQTSLQVGHKIVELNSINCDDQDTQKVAAMVRRAVGVLTLVAVGQPDATTQFSSMSIAVQSGSQSNDMNKSNNSKMPMLSGISNRKLLRKKELGGHKPIPDLDDSQHESCSTSSAFTTTAQDYCETSCSSLSEISHISDKSEAYQHTINAGVLWTTLVGQHVRFPISWFDGARAPHMGVSNILSKAGEKKAQHKWMYIARDRFNSDTLLAQFVPSRTSPGRLLLHIVLRDEKWQPVQDVAIGCYHPFSHELTDKDGDEHDRIVWMAIRKRTGHHTASTALIDPMLSSDCSLQDVATLSPLEDGQQCRNKYLRALFGDCPPEKTIFLTEAELVKRVRTQRTREYITDFKPITLLLLEMFLESRVEV